jgi:hypothetical protein
MEKDKSVYSEHKECSQVNKNVRGLKNPPVTSVTIAKKS